MVFASFEENSKTQCRDREGGELFLLSNTMGLGVFTATISPPFPTPAGPYPDVVRRRGCPARGGGRERGWASPLCWGSATALGTALLPYSHAAMGVRGMVPGALKHRSVRGR